MTGEIRTWRVAPVKRPAAWSRGGVAAALALAILPLTPARADDDISKKFINVPNVAAWTVYGAQVNKTIKDAGVQGGSAIEVKVDAASANPWDAAAQTDVTGKIDKGDQIVTAVWLKAKAADGAPVRLHLRLQANVAPYEGLNDYDLTVGEAWKLYSFTVIAEKAWPAHTVQLAVHLATGKQTVDLGPAFVIDMGPTPAK